MVADHTREVQAADGAAALLFKPPPPQEDKDEAEESGMGAGAEPGYVGRLKSAVLDCVDKARRAPETFEEALAVMKGERAVKPDYGRAVSTVSAVRVCIVAERERFDVSGA